MDKDKVRQKKWQKQKHRNPVARDMNKFTKPATHEDKRRREKERISKEYLKESLKDFEDGE